MTRNTHKIDASGEVLGRLAVKIAVLLRGKQKPGFLKYLDDGDEVEVVNAGKISFTGKKAAQKIYYRHSGYPGGLKAETLEKKFAKNPAEVLRLAVVGMLPKNRTRSKIIKRLKIKVGE